MKLYLNVLWACLFSFMVFAQEKPVKIVFDVTSSDTDVHQSAVRHVKAMSEAYPDSKFEVVMYSGAMDMVLKDKSVVYDDIAKLVQKDNVDFVICEGTMKRHNTNASDLIAGVRSVPDGILEIIAKQKDGWGYIKESK
ncbi:DsrE family protein [Flavobacteriaceae bacterium XHP0103]|uniref:DsrE family protein n=1 Tax=Marixanthotalea marina TaxID=2844359 RepID=UPI002989F42C|nr:DsrE family protein [Marixanthotalea marina]MBU3821539.1 DsrE family protein [Marixanthotalea marina]